MESETRRMILDLISDLQIIDNCNSFNMINMLYGLFDGYDYSDQIRGQHTLLNALNDGGNNQIVNEILNVASMIEKYPRTTNPNNNNF